MSAVSYATNAEVVRNLWSALQANLQEVRQTIEGMSWSGRRLTPISTLLAWRGALDKLQLRADELAPDGRLGVAVASGTLTIERWKAIHIVAWDEANYLRGELKLNVVSGSNLWSQVVLPTVATVKEGAADAVTSPYVLGGVGVVVLVLVLILAVKLS